MKGGGEGKGELGRGIRDGHERCWGGGLGACNQDSREKVEDGKQEQEVRGVQDTNRDDDSLA